MSREFATSSFAANLTALIDKLVADNHSNRTSTADLLRQIDEMQQENQKLKNAMNERDISATARELEYDRVNISLRATVANKSYQASQQASLTELQAKNFHSQHKLEILTSRFLSQEKEKRLLEHQIESLTRKIQSLERGKLILKNSHAEK
jgi:hypothetical protein